MEGVGEKNQGLLSPLYIFFFIGAVVSSYLFGRYQSISQMAISGAKVAGASVSTEQFQITDIKAEVSPIEKKGCLYSTFHLTGSITANTKGTVTYKWEGNDNSTLTPMTVNFNSAGTKTIETGWQVFGPGERWVKLHVLIPNDISSPEISFNLNCS